ncbi:uncharacterized Nudix hydrolase NudL-like [Saccostrea cucullata]|uniref:uncharacterized Nudix hydrolase NudL-like n=1 Tax=Saccostrea cuccullata TaxID=36930 RepID=UPI002ED1B6EB
MTTPNSSELGLVSTVEEISERLKKFDVRHYNAEYTIPEGFVSASVLVPLFIKDGQVYVLLTLRAKHLRSHAGLVAFPGGHVDETDQSVVETALRESEEEIGLPAKNVDVLTVLPPCFVRPNKFVSLVVGIIPANFEPVLNEAEVSKAFSLPLKRFLKEDVKKEFPLNGIVHWLFFFHDIVDGEKIETWGFTGMYCMLIALALTSSDLTIEVSKGIVVNKDSVFQEKRTYADFLRWTSALRNSKL